MSPLQYTKEICNILCLKNGLSPIIVSTVFQFSKKIVKVIIIFKEQISKLNHLAANP